MAESMNKMELIRALGVIRERYGNKSIDDISQLLIDDADISGAEIVEEGSGMQLKLLKDSGPVQEVTFGKIIWTDLTVEDAELLREFYSEVMGWSSSTEDMGDHNDYNMKDSSGNTVAGICHSIGVNQGVPPCWMIYVQIEDMDESLEKCKALNGKVLKGPDDFGSYLSCVIQDPAGACFALFQSK